MTPPREDQAYQLYDKPVHFFAAMLRDIQEASKYVCLQMYKYYDDDIGRQFRDALVEKARQGLEVKVLVDSWGASVSQAFFHDLVKHGGEVRFFTKIKFFIDFFTRNHRRNHRKLLIIDDRISWIGSANITAYSIGWRELMLRIRGDLAVSFRKAFNLDFRIYNKYFFEKNSYIRLIRHGDFEIVRDVPSITKKRINKKFIRLIKNANREVVIETPYFLPGYFLRKAMMDACKRGVKVSVIIPRHSDVMLVDILRNKYLGPLHLSGVRFLYYLNAVLHAKAMLVDEDIFAIGSPNFDYRSFRYMHEIILVGSEQAVVGQLREHIDQSLAHCEPFSYEKWLNRPRFQLLIEWLLLPFRHLL
jgi:cardiolipin synthase